MKTINILLLLSSIFAFSQSKIDSTFNHYFKALELELSENKDLKNNLIYFEEIIIDDTTKVYANKYAHQALFFLQKITKINAPIKYTAQSTASYIDDETLKLWKDWYKFNRKKIKWCKKDKKPYVR